MTTQKEALNPFDAYYKYVGSKPLLDTAASGTAGTALGYYGSNLVLAPLLGTLAQATGASPERVAEVQKMIRRYGALLGGAGGLAYGMGKHMDTGSGAKGAFKSMLSGDYWKESPEARGRRDRGLLDAITSGRKSIRTPEMIKSLLPNPVKELMPTQEELNLQELRRKELERMMQRTRLEQVRGSLQKNQSYQDPFAGQNVPLDYAMGVIQEDPFLSLGKKVVTQGIFEEGAQDGMLTGPGIMNGALRFGAAAVPAYMLGKVITSTLGMPPQTVKLFSSVGGVAAGILNTGIFGDNQ